MALPDTYIRYNLSAMIPNLDHTPPDTFPDVSDALEEPNGLLAVGGDLSAERLVAGYRRGIFPWFGIEDPILWWSPDPRAVFIPGQVHCPRRLARKLRNGDYRITTNQAFEQVIRGCAAPRDHEPDTWLHGPMQMAYVHLHRLGYAHSLEVWDKQDELAGGIYGVALGRAFFAESMFSAQTDGSKIALLKLSEKLKQLGFRFIDAQMMTGHLETMGAREWSRDYFLLELEEAVSAAPAA